jgi:thioredoxin-like negative regulator of GroEL
MSDILIRLAILLPVCLVVLLIVWSGRRFVANQRQQALAAPLPDTLGTSSAANRAPVRILAFSSEDCTQCYRLQTPALQRVVAARGDQIAVVEIDAPNESDLTQRYHVLTVPTTVVLDATGRAHAVNYGFANAQKLLTQVDELLN